LSQLVKIFGVLLTLTVSRHVLEQSLPCPPVDPTWSRAEQDSYQSYCNGYLTGSINNAPKHHVSTKFLRTLLLDPRYKEIMSQNGLHLSRLIIDDPLILTGVQLQNGITISDSDFGSSIDLSYSRISGNLSFPNSNFLRGIRLQHSQIKGSVLLGEDPDIDPDPEKQRGGLILGSLDGEDIYVDGDFNIEGATIPGHVDVSNSHVTGEFSIVRSKLLLVNLGSSIFDGQLILVDDDFRLSQFEESSGDIRFSYSGLSPTSVLNREAISLFLVQCKQSLFLDRSISDRPIVADDAVIDGSLWITGSHLASITATGIQVKSIMRIGFSDKSRLSKRPGENPMTSWTPKAELDLRGASINSIIAPERPEAWPRKVYFANFRLNSFTPGYCNSDAHFPVVENSGCPHNPEWFKTWLALDPAKEHILQHYQNIMNMLQNEGNKEEADYIGVARGDEELWSAFQWPFLKFVFRCAYRVTVGYGYHPEWSIWWLLGLTRLGQPDGISPSRMAEMLEVDKAGPRVRC
jgi:hypothetical protein